jgi:hypothetical protein
LGDGLSRLLLAWLSPWLAHPMVGHERKNKEAGEVVLSCTSNLWYYSGVLKQGSAV